MQSSDRSGSNGGALSNQNHSRVDNTPSVSASGVTLQGANNRQQSTIGLNSRDGGGAGGGPLVPKQSIPALQQPTQQQYDSSSLSLQQQQAHQQSILAQQQALLAQPTALRESNNIVTPPPAKYLLGPLPPEDVGKKCWCTETRILTERGWMFLDELEALQEREVEEFDRLQYACYDKASGAIVYRPGKLIIDPAGVDRTTLYDFSSPDEQRRWAEGSGPYGDAIAQAQAQGNDDDSLSIRVTGCHDMFVQLLGDEASQAASASSTSDADASAAPAPWVKMKAAALADPSIESHAPWLKMSCVAESGLGDVVSDTNDDGGVSEEFAVRLGLTTPQQVDAFLELYGFWIGADGSVRALKREITFVAGRQKQHQAEQEQQQAKQQQEKDVAWVRQTLDACGLVHDADWSEQASGDQVVAFSIGKASWVDYFAEEHKLAAVSMTEKEKEETKETDGDMSGQSSASIISSPSSSEDAGEVIAGDEVPPAAAGAKRFSSWVLRRLGRRHARLVVAGLRRADGSATETKDAPNEIYTRSALLRDQLLQLLLHAGYSARFQAQQHGSSKEGGQMNWAVRYVEALANSSSLAPCAARPVLKRSSIRRVSYTGRVWCVAVEHPDHLVVVQRAHRQKEEAGAGIVSESVSKASRPLVIGQCLVLDLDETLVINIELESVIHRVYVRKRPGVDHFMRVVAEKFEVVIFTASLSKYADPLLDILDRNRVVKARLFREACVQHYGNYVKDLSHLGRRMEDILILDNSPFSYMFQNDNAIPITSWFNDKNDRQLWELIPYLDVAAGIDNVQMLVRSRKPAYGSGVGVPPNLLPPGWQPSIQDADVMNAQQRRGQ